MSVKPQQLENPERDLSLSNRGTRDTKNREEREELDNASVELKAFKERLKAARVLKPQGSDLHCADCFGRGRDAAIKLIEGG